MLHQHIYVLHYIIFLFKFSNYCYTLDKNEDCIYIKFMYVQGHCTLKSRTNHSQIFIYVIRMFDCD